MSLAPGPELLVHSSFDDSTVRRACLRRELIRLAPGRYVRASHWAELTDIAREILVTVAAVSTLHRECVVSHTSAAPFWGLPRLGPPPKRAHVTDPAVSQTVMNSAVVKHAGALQASDVDHAFGVLVTTPRRTVVDIALTVTFRHAVVVLDHCLRVGLATREELRTELESRGNARGRVRAARAIDFADERANRPGESLSRVVMAESGVEPPELQYRFEGPDGEIAFSDFYWRRSRRVGEFDGMTKYRDSGRWSGLDASEVVIREKSREDWMRELPEVRAFTRWTWHDAVTPGRLAHLLAPEVVRKRR